LPASFLLLDPEDVGDVAPKRHALKNMWRYSPEITAVRKSNPAEILFNIN
jgi:hypothetical protein